MSVDAFKLGREETIQRKLKFSWMNRSLRSWYYRKLSVWEGNWIQTNEKYKHFSFPESLPNELKRQIIKNVYVYFKSEVFKIKYEKHCLNGNDIMFIIPQLFVWRVDLLCTQWKP